MKFIYACDIHGDELKYEKILEQAKNQNIKYIVLGGDLLPKMSGDRKLEQSQFIQKYLNQYFSKLKENDIQCICILGNDDLEILDNEFDQMCEAHTNVFNIDNNRVDIEDVSFIGLSKVLDHPFGCKDRVVIEEGLKMPMQLSYKILINKCQHKITIDEWEKYREINIEKYVETSNNSNYNENTNKLYPNLNIDKSKLNIFYLNVGQADSTLITMGEEVMLIDAGNEKDGKYIVQFLKAQGIDEIDYLIETHSDDEHSGGMKTIVNNLSVSNVYMLQSGIAKSEIKDKVSINICSNLEQTYTLDKATWIVLSVNNAKIVKESEDNDTSIVIQLNYGDNKFLFMGDATSKVEKALLNNSEYIKHLSQEAIERLNSINSKIYRTDENGTICITSDGSTIEINEIDINVNGENREARLIENVDILYFFYFNIFPFSSTTV